MTLSLSFLCLSCLGGILKAGVAVSARPNRHRWLSLLWLRLPSWHGSLGRPAAPWLLASMGHSNSIITSCCFVNIGLAHDELLLSALKYGSSCGEIQWSVKCRSESCVCLSPLATDVNTVSFMTTLVVMTSYWVSAGPLVIGCSGLDKK